MEIERRGQRLFPHFETPGQQENASTLGMWVFLATEVLFFGVIFTAYVYLRWEYPSAVKAGSLHLEIVLGSINTAVLLTSSLLMALAVSEAETGERHKASWMIAVTAVLGVLFLLIKGSEYAAVIGHGFLPGSEVAEWQPSTGAAAAPAVAGASSEGSRYSPMPGEQLFFWLYFLMTGLHALHVLIGVGLLAAVACLLRRPQGFSVNAVRNIGLYWHFVDLVWVFLFPLLYLASHRSL